MNPHSEQKSRGTISGHLGTMMDDLKALKTNKGREILKTKVKDAVGVVMNKTVAVWRQGIKGKALLCLGLLVAVGMVLWLLLPSGRNKTAVTGMSALTHSESTAPVLTKNEKNDLPDFKKIRDSEDLFIEGTLPKDIEWEDKYKTSDLAYVSVVPNIIIIPKTVSFESLCASINPNLEDSREKGVAYLNDPQETFGPNLGYAVVSHVGEGYVIVKPSNISWFGNHYGYIMTEDEYVNGARLKFGFYTYTGSTKTVALANGSSRTMYAYRKLDSGLTRKLVDAMTYNEKAVKAAEAENYKRSSEAQKRNEELQRARQAAIDKEFRDHVVAVKKQLDPLFITAIKRPFPMEKIHISTSMKSKIRVSIESLRKWSDKVVEEKGISCRFDDSELNALWHKINKGETTPAAIVNDVCNGIEYSLEASCDDRKCQYKVFAIFNVAPQTDKRLRDFGSVPVRARALWDYKGRHQWYRDISAKDVRGIYIFDMNEDAELYKIWGEGEPQDALEFERAFKEKYGRNKKRTRRQ